MTHNQTVIFTNANTGKNVRQLTPHAVAASRAKHSAATMMVVGYPNVGKSSVINAIARRSGISGMQSSLLHVVDYM